MADNTSKLMQILKKSYFILFFIITIALIYVLYPKQGMFKYEFQKGKPWKHEDLIAPFDFPILKSKEAVEAEKDSLLAGYIPYFEINSEIKKNQLMNLETDIEKVFQSIGPIADSIIVDSFKTYFAGLYSRLYDQGILENSIEMHEPLRGKESIYIVADNKAKIVSKESVLSLKSAYLKLNNLIKEEALSDTLFLNLQQKLDFNKYLEPNLFYDKNANETAKAELLAPVSTTRGLVPEGVRIISQGDVVSGEKYVVLESLKQAYEHKRYYGGWFSVPMIGQLLLVLALMGLLVVYLTNFNRKIFQRKRNFSLILSTILITFLLARLIYDNPYLSFYLLPICILPIIIRTFVGARIAIFVHLLAVLMVGFLAPNSFEYIFIQFFAGTIAVVSLSKLHRRGHLVITSLLVTLSYFVLFFIFEMIKEGNFQTINWKEFIWLAGNGMLILIAYPLIYIYEKIFGFISDVTLMELSDTNHPLLRRLAEQAPGTFQHSMQVANMAEEFIAKTYGNPMLVRTGALYHDVGKIQSSQFFIENQSAGQSPHKKLSYTKSAEKIISHVAEGVALARKHNIPDSIIDFIKTHHGKGVARYFYLKYKEENPDKEVDIEKFMYPGPNPVSRETAVVMLADGVEAAARSLPEKNEQTLKKVIDQIIDAKVQNHELDEAPITFKDIKDIKAIFLEKLKNIYHVRIQYPSENEK
ncbi:MAG: HDIG domain-containing protein [Prolixibacteraceae bacterium]|nr:HDIG domain-containing protein [Prolixibacteraceae bacterium]